MYPEELFILVDGQLQLILIFNREDLLFLFRTLIFLLPFAQDDLTLETVPAFT